VSVSADQCGTTASNADKEKTQERAAKCGSRLSVRTRTSHVLPAYSVCACVCKHESDAILSHTAGHMPTSHARLGLTLRCLKQWFLHGVWVLLATTAVLHPASAATSPEGAGRGAVPCT